MAIDLFTSAANIMAAGSLAFIVYEILLFIISALFLWIGAKVAQVKKGSFGRAFLIAIITAVLTPILLIPFGAYALIAFILGLIINLIIIKLIFATGWRKSVVAWVFSIVAGVIAILILAFGLVLLL